MKKCERCGKMFDEGIIYWKKYCAATCGNTARCARKRQHRREKLIKNDASNASNV